MVLYNRESRLVTVRRQMPPEDPMATAATTAATASTHPPTGSPIQVWDDHGHSLDFKLLNPCI